MSEQQKKLAEYVYQIATELPREALCRLTIYGEGLRDAKGLEASARTEQRQWTGSKRQSASRAN